MAAAIRQQIVAKEFVVGQRLPTERELAASNDVSRNVVREAIRLLVREGLVDVKQGSGTYVTDGTSKALSEWLNLTFALAGGKDALAQLVEARNIIEPTLAALAAERATEDDIREMRAAIEEMDLVSDDPDAFIEADQRFHLMVARASYNSVVPLMLGPIVDLLKAQRSEVFRTEDTSPAQGFHRAIIDAIERRDSQSAFASMKAHLKQIGEAIAHLK